LKLVEHHAQRHQLGEACRRDQIVGGLLEQHRSGLSLDQDDVRRRERRRRRPRMREASAEKCRHHRCH
jgi:hypothetical protein